LLGKREEGDRGKMEFDKTRVYTALNADELKPGDKVIVADQLAVLKQRVQEAKEYSVVVLKKINGEDWGRRFGLTMSDHALAYLVERAETEHDCQSCKYKNCGFKDFNTKNECDRWETEVKAEMPELISLGNGQYVERKHYRPFRDTDELLKEWNKKLGYTDPTGSKLTEPYIWVKYKYDENNKGSLITVFGDDYIYLGDKDEDIMTMYDLFINYTFLDDSPCGVEE
jgi:hypothetical protein